MKAAFLDRDGVINVYPGDFQYVTRWEDFHFLPNVITALKKLTDNNFKIFIVSNQAGVSKGVYSQGALDLITHNLLKELASKKIDIAGIFYCTHRPEDNCRCRKPKTGLVDLIIGEQKEKGSEIELERSFFIGDTIRDIETGKAANLKTILVFSGKEKPENKDTWKTPPDFTAKDLREAADIMLMA